MGGSKAGIIIAAVMCAAIAVISGRAWVDSPQKQSVSHAQAVPASKMQQKLKEAQGLLRSITYKDFGNIKTGAQKLSEISFEAQWSESTTPRYDMFSEEFRYNLTNIADAAEAGNLEAVTLSYMRLIMNCVNCHEEVREGEEIAFLSDPQLNSLFEKAWESN